MYADDSVVLGFFFKKMMLASSNCQRLLKSIACSMILKLLLKATAILLYTADTCSYSKAKNVNGALKTFLKYKPSV